MKIDRLMGILTLLLQQEKLTAPELARRFEVSRRTINRDIEDLCKAGIPIVTNQGYGGGIHIAKGYTFDKNLFTREELQTILTGLRGIDSVSAAPARPNLMDKLSGQDDSGEEDILIINLASHYHDSITPKIEMIKKAISGKRLITFRYYSQKGESTRVIEPYHIIFQWSSWYVLGYCLEKNDFRLFKLNRLWEPRPLEQAFTPRPVPREKLEFDRFFSTKSIHLKAYFSPGAKHRLIDEYGVACFSETPEGRLLFERDFVRFENLLGWVLSFGGQVYVEQPTALREAVKKQLELTLELYQKNIFDE